MGGSAKPAWWSRGSRKEGQPWVHGPAADTGGKVMARDEDLNPETGLSKQCPPSLEEQKAEERVQPQARESRQQEKGSNVTAPQNEKSARREVGSGLSVGEGVPRGSQAQGLGSVPAARSTSKPEFITGRKGPGWRARPQNIVPPLL